MVVGLVVSLVLTIVLNLCFPIFYLKTNGKVEKKKAKKIALLNWIICFIIVYIVGVIINGTQGSAAVGTPNIFAGWIYYLINKKLLTKNISSTDANESQHCNDDSPNSPVDKTNEYIGNSESDN